MPITHGWTTAQSDDPAYDVSADELNDHSGTEDHGHTATGDGGLLAAGAPTGADYLVGTANGGLSAEIVVGTSPNGELGGSWSSITVDATHSGSTHAATQAAAESTAASALSGHVAAGDPHTGYRLESAAIVEGDLSTSDITTANATTSKHGFVPKLPNDATKYYDGTGAYTVPAGGGGGGSDLTIPSGGTLYDGSSTSGWTSFGSPDTFDANSTIPGAFYLQKTTMGTNNLVGAYRAVSSLPRTYTMKVLDGFYHANYHGINLILAEAVPGKLVSWGANFDTNSHYLQRQAWTTAASAGTNTVYGGGTVLLLPTWYRIVVNSSTDIEVWQSMNGYIYYRYAAAVNPGFTIGNYGFAMFTFAAIEMKAAIDWIHET